MESSINRPAVELATDRPRPGLALLLALLAVPGSTLAWDLPAGGLYIGLPLGITAIVLGVRARRGHLSGAERRAPVLRGEVALHEGQAALGHHGVQVAGGAVQRRREIPCVHRELGALPIDRGGSARLVVLVPGPQEVVRVRPEGAGGIAPGRRGRGRPVDRLTIGQRLDD